MILGFLNSRWPNAFAVLILFFLGVLPSLYSQDSSKNGSDSGPGKISRGGKLA